MTNIANLRVVVEENSEEKCVLLQAKHNFLYLTFIYVFIFFFI